jgi:16S rRNA (cytosine967-C5)-methyltransferase
LEKNLVKKEKVKIQNSKFKISLARISAFEILLKIEKERAFSSILLPIYEANLSANDRALCHELVLGVLRKQIYLDKIIENFSNKKLDLEVRIALRIGLYQLLFLDKIPAYSAINESVNLVVKAKKTSAKGFVNAILRRVTREKIELNFADETERISVETSHPRWLIEKWISQFGIEETEKLAVANNQTPDLNFRFTAKTTDAIKKSLETSQPERSFLRDLAENGKIYFQDEGSQLIGKSVGLQNGEKFLDICAAPGSKATLVASEKAKVKSENLFVAGDSHWNRVRILRENCLKQGINFINILQYDAEKSLPFADETFDVVLLDAPCSGTGTIRHNPEIRYHLQEKDFRELSAKQLRILENASKILKRGGRLIYSTCSLEKEENEGVIESFLSANEHFSVIKNDIYAKFSNEKGYARTFPQRDAMDGFFIVTMKKS